MASAARQFNASPQKGVASWAEAICRLLLTAAVALSMKSAVADGGQMVGWGGLGGRAWPARIPRLVRYRKFFGVF